jgi:hypothetical protein
MLTPNEIGGLRNYLTTTPEELPPECKYTKKSHLTGDDSSFFWIL